jgi:hypothetical protein
MKKIIVVLILVFISQCGIAQEEFSMEAIGYYELNRENDRIEIPFEIHNGDILVKPKINGIPTRMYVDNGTLWDQVYFFGSPILETLNLDYTGEIEVGGAGEGEKMLNYYSEGLWLDFGNVCFYNQPAIISPPELGMQNYWTDVDGQISAQFFKHFITEIDYDKMIIILYELEDFKPPIAYIPVQMTSVGNGSFSIPIEIKMNDDVTLKRDVILDLGGSCNFSYHYYNEDKLDFDNDEFKTLGYGAQGEIRGYRKKVKEFDLAGFKIIEPIGEFVKRAGQDDHNSSIVGLEILSQFNTIFDYQNNVLYIKPNQNFNK